MKNYKKILKTNKNQYVINLNYFKGAHDFSLYMNRFIYDYAKNGINIFESRIIYIKLYSEELEFNNVYIYPYTRNMFFNEIFNKFIDEEIYLVHFYLKCLF